MTRRTEYRLPPKELAARWRYEDTPAKRLVALEAADPSQRRPKKVPCIWDVVDFMVWETHRDLGLKPLPRRC
jgi:hypothetical protein